MHERTAATVSLPQADVASGSSKYTLPLPAAPSGALIQAGGMVKKDISSSFRIF